MRVRPQARSSKTTLPPGSENPPYCSSRSWPRCLPHHQPYGWSTRDESTRVHQNSQGLFPELRLSSGSVAGEDDCQEETGLLNREPSVLWLVSISLSPSAPSRRRWVLRNRSRCPPPMFCSPRLHRLNGKPSPPSPKQGKGWNRRSRRDG